MEVLMIQLDSLRAYLLEKKGSTEERPFGPDTLVFKVVGKMFALITWQVAPLRLNLKCDPELALILRGQYEAVLPGYHMNKEHWNTVVLDGTIPDAELRGMIDHSYDLVVKSLKKVDRQKLESSPEPAAQHQ
jgi:predicted DNA-binding protein (MmcQ/YjbR family)